MLVSQAINRALRLLGVLDAVDTPAAVDSQTALDVLNSQMQRWEANGLAVGWVNATAISGTLQVPDEAQEAVIYNLALKLSPEYGMPSTTGMIADMAQAALASLRRDRLVEMPITLRSDLPSRSGYWNINTDEPV